MLTLKRQAAPPFRTPASTFHQENQPTLRPFHGSTICPDCLQIFVELRYFATNMRERKRKKEGTDLLTERSQQSGEMNPCFAHRSLLPKCVLIAPFCARIASRKVALLDADQNKFLSPNFLFPHQKHIKLTFRKITCVQRHLSSAQSKCSLTVHERTQ